MFLENPSLMMQRNSLKVVLKPYSKAGMAKKPFHIAVLKAFRMIGVQQ